jgi:predicted nucleic acid-binding protein
MTNGSSEWLVDTNILVYVHDPKDVEKQRIATEVITSLIKSRRAALSAQCLTEFFNVTTKRLGTPIPSERAARLVEDHAAACRVYALDERAVLLGCRAASVNQMALWDAHIWAVAKVNGIPVILTEDMQHRLEIEGVRYINPFAEDFDLITL